MQRNAEQRPVHLPPASEAPTFHGETSLSLVQKSAPGIRRDPSPQTAFLDSSSSTTPLSTSGTSSFLNLPQREAPTIPDKVISQRGPEGEKLVVDVEQGKPLGDNPNHPGRLILSSPLKESAIGQEGSERDGIPSRTSAVASDGLIDRPILQTSKSSIQPLSEVTITTVSDVPEFFWDLPKDLDRDSVFYRDMIGPYVLDPTKLTQEGRHGYVVGAYTPKNEPVAIKISRMSSPQATYTIQREAAFHEIAASVTDNVPQLIEVGTFSFDVKDFFTSQQKDRQQPFAVLITELIQGKSLSEIGFEDLDISTVKRRYIPLAHAIDAIGQAGIVHRDIKRGNIIIDNDGIARLIDFGIATTVGAIPSIGHGAPLCRSPEHETTGVPLTEATNVFQFGLLIYRELTGNEMIPYRQNDGYDFTQLLETNQYEQHVRARLQKSRLPRRLLPFFSKIFALDPAERPTAVEFIMELGKIY